MKSSYQPYFTNSPSLLARMTSLLALDHGQSVLEPCAGEGAFIDAVLATCKGVNIDAFEINDATFSILNEKYRTIESVKCYHVDSLTDANVAISLSRHSGYDRIIANPPYGAWQDYDRRSKLKSLFPGFYVRETYSLFLIRSIQLLKQGGRLVFIIPSTFLNLHLHKRLREFLFRTCRLLTLDIFPSSFFPGVCYGYGEMCIISLEKCNDIELCMGNTITVTTGFSKPENLITHDGAVQVRHIPQVRVYENIDHALFLSNAGEYEEFVNCATMRLSSAAECLTGFYSGDDLAHLYVANHSIKRYSHYEQVDPSLVLTESMSLEERAFGLQGKRHIIPILKGARSLYHKPTEWYIDWSTRAVAHYKSAPKARFQNARFYFLEGIGVPMVRSSRLSAFLLNCRLFDQSIVGVFPKEVNNLLYILGYLNSSIADTLIKLINPSANNSANYIKKLPFAIPSKRAVSEISKMVTRLYDISARASGPNNDEAVQMRLNELYKEIVLSQPISRQEHNV